MGELATFTKDKDAQEINHLHAEAHAHAETAVKKAILVGQRLAAKKLSLPHGSWTAWVEKNLTFGESMARKYMQVASNQERVTDLGAQSIREAVRLLAEVRPEVPDTSDDNLPDTPVDNEPELQPYNNDPDLVKERDEAQRAANCLNDDVQRMVTELERVNADLQTAKDRAADLEKLEADRDRVDTALRQINELEKKQTELFEDSRSLDLAMEVVVRSRTFFTNECVVLAALHFRPNTLKAIRPEMAELLQLVQNWHDSMTQKFLEATE